MLTLYMHLQIKEEQASTLKAMTDTRLKCGSDVKAQDKVVQDSMKLRNDNADLIKDQNSKLVKDWNAYVAMWAAELVSIKAIEGVQGTRMSESTKIAGEVDERNKAIDVMVKAAFLVCERFVKYKNTLQCREIKSQPDVPEPPWVDTKASDKSKVETALTHTLPSGASADEAPIWLKKWTSRLNNDKDKVGKSDPEGLLVDKASRDQANAQHAVQNITEKHQDSKIHDKRSAELKKNDRANKVHSDKAKRNLRGELAEAQGSTTSTVEAVSSNVETVSQIFGSLPIVLPNEEETLYQLGEGGETVVELGDDASTGGMTSAEMEAHAKITQMVKTAELKPEYSLPITELLVSLKEGATKQKKYKSKSIVGVLLGILKAMRAEQEEAVSEHTKKLNLWYHSLDDMVSNIILPERDQEKAYLQNMLDYRAKIAEKQQESETTRKSQDKAWEARTSFENSCKAAEVVYADEEALRVDDLENIRKLKSLLRGLYDKKMPKKCPKFGGQICSGHSKGWCIYDQETTGDKQSCSCNEAFYGDACQYKKCPGFASTLYGAKSPGSCSDRGSCDPSDGTCHCENAFYHGPKNACDYKHAPKSKNGKIDNKCTEGRGVLDKVRGTCKCDFKYFGPGCEEKKCPNSNGVLYPGISGNACNGHGACNTVTGECACADPFFSGDKKSCELENCYQKCKSPRGTCDVTQGKCNCVGNNFGSFCQWKACPFHQEKSCNGHGTCMRNTGSCICKIPYSGPTCEQTSRCKSQNLHNDKMNWWTAWDKPGWLLCPTGQLLYKLDRSSCATLPDPKNDPMKASSTGGALSCIESGGCASPCEKAVPNEYNFQIRHCYHDLKWYNEFDHKGYAGCQSDYFVAGLYRSCESLYCLNMVKCCSLMGEQPSDQSFLMPYGATKQARWYGCGFEEWGSNFNGKTEQQMTGTVPEGTFITGFRRGAGHTLQDIEAASYCKLVRGY